MRTIIKRDGKEAMFDDSKIFNAIFAANNAVSGEKMAGYDISYLTKKVVELLDGETCTVEQVQDIVESILIKFGYDKTAKAYILYRAEHAKIREAESDLMNIYNELTYSYAKDADIKRENANIDGDTSMGTMLKYGSEGAKYYVDNYILPKDIAKAHINGDIHIHDKDFYMLTETCIDENSPIVVELNGNPLIVTPKDLEKKLNGLSDVDNIVETESLNLRIMSNGEFVKVLNAVSHTAKGKRLLEITTETGAIRVTDNHRITVSRGGYHEDVHARDVRPGDTLIVPSINPDRFALSEIDLIELFKDNDRIVVLNSKDVIEDIKKRGQKGALNKILNYKSRRAVSVRDGYNRMTVPEFIKIEHLTSLSRKELKLAHKRTRADESINAVMSLTKELGRFIGLMFSDGSVSAKIPVDNEPVEKKVCFTGFDESLISSFNESAASVFNNAKLMERHTDDRHSGTILSGYLAYELFHGPFGEKYGEHSISLAPWMYVANMEFLSGLLGGIVDGDGTVQRDGYRISIASICESYLRQLQTLLNFRGITSHIRENSGSEPGTNATFSTNGKTVKINRTHNNYVLDITGNLWLFCTLGGRSSLQSTAITD